MPLCHYGILLPEEDDDDDASLSLLLNLIIVELKQILGGFLTIKDNNIKFVIDIYGHGGNYSGQYFFQKTHCQVTISQSVCYYVYYISKEYVFH